MRDGEGSKDINQAPLAEWSKALRSGRSLHSKAQVRILRGAKILATEAGFEPTWAEPIRFQV